MHLILPIHPRNVPRSLKLPHPQNGFLSLVVCSCSLTNLSGEQTWGLCGPLGSCPWNQGISWSRHPRTRGFPCQLTVSGEADQTSHQGKGGEPTSGSCGQGRARCSRGRETFLPGIYRELKTSNSTSLVEIGINGQINSKNRESPRGVGTCFLYCIPSPCTFSPLCVSLTTLDSTPMYCQTYI